MMTTELDRLLEESKKLSAKDRKQLAALLAYNATNRNGFKQDSTGRPDDSLWQAVCEVTRTPEASRRNMIGKQATDDRRIPVEQWEFAVSMMNNYIDTTCAVTLNIPQRQRLMVALVECLKSMNRQLGKGTSAKEIINSVINLDDAVDLEFPGYGDAGLLHRLADPVLEPV
jgi:hypothetical protein